MGSYLVVGLAGAEGGQTIVQLTDLDRDGIQVLALSEGLIIDSRGTSLDGDMEGLSLWPREKSQLEVEQLNRVQQA